MSVSAISTARAFLRKMEAAHARFAKLIRKRLRLAIQTFGGGDILGVGISGLFLDGEANRWRLGLTHADGYLHGRQSHRSKLRRRDGNQIGIREIVVEDRLRNRSQIRRRRKMIWITLPVSLFQQKKTLHEWNRLKTQN